MTINHCNYLIPCLVLSLIVGTGCSAQQVDIEREVDRLFEPWNKADIPGASVAVVKDGKIVYKKGFGCANLEYGIPNKPSTVFHVASVSKQVTAFAILLLEQEGKLSLDDDVRKYIPELHDFGKIITLRQLALHNSGLRDQWNLLTMAGWRLDDVITQEQILKLVYRQEDLNFNPGDEHLYCNTGYTLLAEVVTRVSGKSFADFSRERIFEPLGMHNTLFYDDHEIIVKNRAYSYYAEGSGYKKSVLNYANVGATSLFTTVEDLSLWALNFEHPVVGNINTVLRLQERGILNNGDTIHYALGQDVGEYKGLTFINHGGADAGYRSFIGRFPDQHFAVIVFSNLASFDPFGIALKIADIYLKTDFLPEKHDLQKKPEEAPAFPANADALKTYCGDYEMQPGFVIHITQGEDKLYVEAPELARTQLVQISNVDFTVPGPNAKVTFAGASNGEITQLIVNLNGERMVAPRKGSFNKDMVKLEAYAGEYYSEELGTTYIFSVIDGKLMATHIRLKDFELIPVNTDQFTSGLWYFNKVDFKRNASNQVSGCLVSGGRVRNLKFDKVN